MDLNKRNRIKFPALDDLRAVAALAVVVFHYSSYFGNVIPSAYLSVDLFFCISGVVIAHSYGELLKDTANIKQFLYIRICRLYPLFLLSVLVQGSILILSVLFGKTHLNEALSQILPALLFLPSPFHASLYPINGPAWSLFFEILINIVAALLWRSLSNIRIIIIVVVFTVVLLCLTVYFGTIDGGYNWSGIALAISRVSYSFFFGILIYRWRRDTWPITGAGIYTAVIFLVMISMEHSIYNDLICVIFVFPMLTFISLHAKPMFSNASNFIGKISYPLYVLHFPILVWVANIAVFSGLYLTLNFGIAAVLITILISWFAERYYDRPIQRYLKRSYSKNVA